MKESLDVNPLANNLVEIMWRFGPQGLDKQCCDDLSMAEYCAMTIITQVRSCSVQDVAKHLGFTKSGATRIANRLEKKGYITKERSEQDNRICCLSPTNEGLSARKNAENVFTESLKTVLAVIPEEQRKNLAESLDVMAKAIKIVG